MIYTVKTVCKLTFLVAVFLAAGFFALVAVLDLVFLAAGYEVDQMVRGLNDNVKHNGSSPSWQW